MSNFHKFDSRFSGFTEKFQNHLYLLLVPTGYSSPFCLMFAIRPSVYIAAVDQYASSVFHAIVCEGVHRKTLGSCENSYLAGVELSIQLLKNLLVFGQTAIIF